MQTNTRSAIDALSVLSQSAHSPFHCCKYCEDTLKKAGFLALPKNEPISLTPGGKYYIDLYDATCLYGRQESLCRQKAAKAAYDHGAYRLAFFSDKTTA